MGVANNSTQTNCIHMLHTSNVGIGTNNPTSHLHVYNGVTRLEELTSNSTLEFKTTAGISNIYSDTTGNVHISPCATDATVFLKGDADIQGDLLVNGNIDLSFVKIGLPDEEATTDLQTGGGTIINKSEVARKTYAKSFSIAAGDAKDIQIIFNNGAFFAMITAILRRTDDDTVVDVSTLSLGVQGGTGDESQSTVDVAVGENNIFGGTNNYPWSSTITTGKRGISITPYNTDGTRIYSYDIFVELITACGGKLEKITRDLSAEADLDDGTGGQTEITTFSY